MARNKIKTGYPIREVLEISGLIALYMAVFWIDFGKSFQWLGPILFIFGFSYPIAFSLWRREPSGDIFRPMTPLISRRLFLFIFFFSIGGLLIVLYQQRVMNFRFSGQLVAGFIRIPYSGLVILLLLYPVFALWQQFVLFGFLFPRFKRIWAGHEFAAGTCCVLLFVASHLPNWPLALLSLLGGLIFFWLYTVVRNILVSGIVHGFLGIVVFLILAPYRWTFLVGCQFIEAMKLLKN